MITNKMFQGSVKSAFTCSPIAEVKINLFDDNNKLLGSTHSDKKGRWFINIDEKADHLVFEKTGYSTKSLKINNEPPTIVRLLEDSIIGYLDKLAYRPGGKY